MNRISTINQLESKILRYSNLPLEKYVNATRLDLHKVFSIIYVMVNFLYILYILKIS